jgi:hypothetical protein
MPGEGDPKCINQTIKTEKVPKAARYYRCRAEVANAGVRIQTLTEDGGSTNHTEHPPDAVNAMPQAVIRGEGHKNAEATASMRPSEPQLGDRECGEEAAMPGEEEVIESAPEYERRPSNSNAERRLRVRRRHEAAARGNSLRCHL